VYSYHDNQWLLSFSLNLRFYSSLQLGEARPNTPPVVIPGVNALTAGYDRCQGRKQGQHPIIPPPFGTYRCQSFNPFDNVDGTTAFPQGG
jgi:hypothetical protein